MNIDTSKMTDKEYFEYIGQAEEAAREWAALDLDGEGLQVSFDWQEEADCQ